MRHFKNRDRTERPVDDPIRRLDSGPLAAFWQRIRKPLPERALGSFVEHSLDGILTIDRSRRIRTANRAAGQIFGLDAEAMMGLDVGTLIPEARALFGKRGLMRAANRGWRELTGRHADGHSLPLEVGVTRIATVGAPTVAMTLRDISERKQRQAELEHQALHDPLTGLPNRMLLAERLAHSLAQAERAGKPVALLLLDLDRFKAVNDTLGHQFGDRLLCQVAQRLLSRLRPQDTIARLGGDEFAVLLKDVEGQGAAEAVARSLVESLCEAFSVEGLSLEIGVSIGVALYPTHAEETARLLQCADVAMYMAKREGTGLAVYDEERDHNSVRHLTITGELRRAIETHQLSFHYQPKIDLFSGRVIGVEALIRWQHQELGFVPPDEFIVLAEQTGLIEPITYWGFEQACTQYNLWRARDLDIGIAINLSARCLHQPTLPEHVMAILERWSVPPEKITVEITETAIMSDPERAETNVARLHEHGLRLSVDDFGTGHSSLAYLRRLPLDELKIDRSFVMQMTDNDDDAVIVRSTIDLAHSLGLKVVAEGVESERHLKILRALDCDTAQGYHISRPVTVDQLETWHEARQAQADDDFGPFEMPALATA